MSDLDQLHAEAAGNPDTSHPAPEAPSAAVRYVSARQPTEQDEAYGAVVAILTDKIRVINGRCGLQWIMQARTGPKTWKSLAFCGTKEGLLMRLKEHLQGRHERIPLDELALRCDTEAWAAIMALPEFFPKAKDPSL